MSPNGIRRLLKESFLIIDLAAIGKRRGMDFPATYWVAAKLLGKNVE